MNQWVVVRHVDGHRTIMTNGMSWYECGISCARMVETNTTVGARYTREMHMPQMKIGDELKDSYRE